MRHDILLITTEHDPRLLQVLRQAGCSVRSAANLRTARQALRSKPVDLIYADLPLPTASFRLTQWAARAGVPAMVVALPSPGDHTDVPTPRPEVLRFVCRTTPPGVVRRVILTGLEDLEACRQLRLADATARAWPVAVVSSSGQILFASPEGSEAVAAVSAPTGPRPVRRLDPKLLQRVRSAVKPGTRIGHVALFRRDGVLSHYETHVRRIEGGHFALLMLDARTLARTPPGPPVINLVDLLKRHRRRGT